MAVEVLSQAFTVSHPGDGRQPQQQNQLQLLHATCASKLGVAAERVRVYALTEVHNLSEVLPRCDRVAVEVKGSRKFTAEQRQVPCTAGRESACCLVLALVAAHLSPSPRAGFSLQALEQVLVENKSLASTATASDATIKHLQALLAAAQQENASLRKQLDSSEVLRHRSHSLLHELKQEFEALHTELAPHANPTAAHTEEGMSTPTAANPGRGCL